MLTKLFDRIRETATTELVIDSRRYVSGSVQPIKEPLPVALEVDTLSAVVEYAKSVYPRDRPGAPLPIVQVLGPRTVRVISELVGQFCQRNVYLCAEELFCWARGGEWMIPELFVIMLQSQFVSDETVAAILKLVGNVEDVASVKTMDDGTTQTVVAKTGILKVDTVVVPPRVTLTPYRSFVEAPQAASPFILRMQSGQGQQLPKIALFEADGGAWRIQAMTHVRTYLQERLPQGVVVLA